MKNATNKDTRTIVNPETLLDLVIPLSNSYANFSFPGDQAHRNDMARYVHPTKRYVEESKKRRKMAARSRKLNRKGK
jgi:hypothetical protein